MKEAAALFENLPGNPDPHYPSALAGLAEACFHRGELDEAEAYYRQAMELINRLYGKNDGWQTLNRNREQERLRLSYELAVAAGYTSFIQFLHYPPTSIGEEESGFTRMALEYGADQVIYAHCHGKDRFQDSFLGNVDGVNYRLVSSDYLKFKPERILT